MENKMQVFQNEEFGRLRTFVAENGVLWFVGKDVAGALGYSNASKAVMAHVDADDKQFIMVWWADSQNGNVPIGQTKTAFINESGLYSLILSSKLDSAKRFKHWVTSEVLPSIRKHGAYMTDSLLEQVANNADVAAQVVKELAEERKLNKALAGQLQTAESQLTKALPKASYFDALVACPDSFGVRLTAKELGVPQSMFTAYLVRKKYAYYDQDGKMHPYAIHYRNGLFIVREFIAANGHRGTQMLITPKGRQVFLAELDEITG